MLGSKTYVLGLTASTFVPFSKKVTFSIGRYSLKQSHTWMYKVMYVKNLYCLPGASFKQVLAFLNSERCSHSWSHMYCRHSKPQWALHPSCPNCISLSINLHYAAVTEDSVFSIGSMCTLCSRCHHKLGAAHWVPLVTLNNLLPWLLIQWLLHNINLWPACSKDLDSDSPIGIRSQFDYCRFIPSQNLNGVGYIKKIKLHVNRRGRILPGHKCISTILQHHLLNSTGSQSAMMC